MQEVFEKITEKLKEKSYEIRLDGSIVDSAKKVVELSDIVDIVNQIAAEYNNGWILCSERLPDYYCSLEVTLSNGSRSICRYTGMVWKTLVSMKTVDVIAWKEPTEPYLTKGE